VVCGERTLTYTDLDREADALAARLAAVASVGPGRVVAVLVERDEWMPVAVLALLRTGSAFLPLDPDQSAARLSAVLRDSRAVAALTSARFAAVATAERLPVVPVGGPAGVHPVPAGAAYPRAGREDLAFVVYTSGSTGTPKGVMIRHAGVVNSIVFRIGYYGLGPGRAHLQVDPIHTDAGIDDLFSALCSGAPTVIVTREQLLTPAEVATALRRHDVRHVTLVPSLYQMLLDEVCSAFAGVRQIVLGGERVTRALVVRHRQFLPRAALFNEYGPAEDSCVTTVDEVVLPSGTLCGDATIGRPLPGKWVDLVDEKGELVPWGAAGELCIGGAGLARGYLGDPELTDARFVPSRVRPGERNYRTGDLARWLPDGRLEYLGRGDDQLKIRGNRVEPNEVGAVLARAPGLRNAAVVPIAGPDGAPRLIAYVAGETPTAVLRRYLAQRLPAYMMPEAFVHLATLPVAQSGKLDRRALPPPVEEPDDGEVPVRPFTAAERRVADVWTEALGRPVADPDANLFDLGGHSLTAARIAHALGVRVHAVFTHQTVSALAAACADNPAPAGERQPGDEGGATGPGFLPLSRAQRRVWLTSRRSGTDTFLVSNVVRPGRHLEPDALRRALEAVVERQDMLRAYARPRGWEAELAVEQRLPDGVPLVMVPLPGADPAGPQVTEALHDARRVTFPLDVAPLFEVRLLHGVAGGDLLTVTAHHLIYDGASVDVLLTDLFTAYDRIVTGAEPGLPPLELSYQEWIRQEQRWLAGPEAERQLAYWRDRLAGVEPGPDPVDPGRRGSRRGRTGMVGVVVPAEPLAGVPATPFAQVVTAFAETVHRRTGATDLVIGFAAGLRDRPETDALIGYLVNALALRIAVDDAGPRELLPRVQDGIVEAYEHSRLPFDLLAERLRLRARPGRSVLLDLGVSWENASLAGEFEAVEDLLPDDLPATSDMWLYARVRPDGLHLDLTYDDHLLTPAEAAAYLDEVAGVLRGLGSAADSVGSDAL
jgi:amino acid adenylation domain-containing protein